MKIATSTLLISAALAAFAPAAPVVREPLLSDFNTRVITKRCAECTHKDSIALDLIVKASATHYSSIAHAHLDSLMTEIESAKVTSGGLELPREKAMLSVTVQSKIEQTRKDCSPEALAPEIKATVASDASLDIAWSKEEEIRKKMAELDLMITKLMLERIQVNINAELLSKDCTEKMTTTEIAPAPAPTSSQEQAPFPVEQPAQAPAPVEAPAPPAAPEEAPAPAPFLLRLQLRLQWPQHLALLALTLRQTFRQEVPTACAEKRDTLLGGVLKVVADLNVGAKANA
ncbi:MAG: hypothetical protein J3Q66DRAFT_403941 [Benniella sp.]|nr:MAG: hypothetical protein J3Q66DRAFT_403941 [Benniella sp.]